MNHPLGKAPVQTGVTPTPAELPVFQGTSSLDMQRILGAQYMSSGILPNGGLTVRGTSSMAYAVDAGAAFMWSNYATRRGMLVGAESTTVVTNPAPATGSRIDTIYLDGDGAVRVAIGSTSIPEGVAIAQFTVPAGITATTSAQQDINRRFAIATGASLGRLGHWRDPGGGAVGPNEKLRYQKDFFLPSDRVLRVDLTTTLHSVTSTPGVAELEIQFDGGLGGASTRRMLAGHTPQWDTYTSVWSFVAAEGPHSITLKTRAYSGGTWEYANNPDSVTEMSLWDAGVLQ